MVDIVQYRKASDRTENTDSAPSANIWFDLPPEWAINKQGCEIWEDFVNSPSMISAQDVGLFATYIDTGVTLNQSAAGVGGVLAIVQDGTDNDEGWLTTGGNQGGAFLISDTAGADKKLWFEARVKVSSIVDDVVAFFVGLSEEGLAGANTMVDDTGVMADKDYIGFNTVHVNGGTTGLNAVLRFTYKKAGQTAQTVLATLDTLVADTYVKLGFKYDPSELTTKRIKVYLNGVEQSTYVTATNIATATFPDGEELAVLFGSKAGTGTASTTSFDWIRVAQERA